MTAKTNSKNQAKKKKIDDGTYDSLEDTIKEIIDDPAKTMTSYLKKKLDKGLKPAPFDPDKIVIAQYRPFIKQYLYYDTYWIDSPNQIPRFYPPPKVDGGGGYINQTEQSASQTSTQADSAHSSQTSRRTSRLQGTARSLHHRQEHAGIQRTHHRECAGPQLHEPDTGLSVKQRRSLIVPDKITGRFTAHVSDNVPDLHIVDANQVFPQNIKGHGGGGKLSMCITDKTENFSVMLSGTVPDLELVHHGQVFPQTMKRGRPQI